MITAVDRPLRRWAGTTAGILVVGAALALPAPPDRTAAGPTRPGSGTAAATIADAWPQAKPFTFAAGQPDGQRYAPLLFLDAGTSVGRLVGADQSTSTMVLRTADTMRAVTPSAPAGSDVIAVTASSTGLYWVRVSPGGDGNAHYAIWAANRDGTTPRPVTDDPGDVTVYDPESDLQVADGRLYWLASRDGPPGALDLRSVPVDGGAVTRRPVDGNISMSTWPWIATVISPPGDGADLTNLVTSERRHIPAGGNEQLSCSPTWCWVTAMAAAGPSAQLLRRPDGSDVHRLGTDLWPALPTVILDRFAVVATNGTPTLAGATVKLSLYDLATRRTVLVDPGAIDVGARAGYLWWSTGAGESLTWHVLDLHNLP